MCEMFPVGKGWNASLIATLRHLPSSSSDGENVVVGGHEAGPGLVVGIRVGLGIEARLEGQHTVEGQPQQPGAYPPFGVRCGHISVAPSSRFLAPF